MRTVSLNLLDAMMVDFRLVCFSLECRLMGGLLRAKDEGQVRSETGEGKKEKGERRKGVEEALP